MDARIFQEYCGYNFTSPADCPPETGGTRSEVTEGVDKTNHYHLNLSTPSPLRGTHPCLRGRKWVLGYFRNTVVTISPRQQIVPLRQVGRGAKRRRGWIKPITTHYYLLLIHPLPTAWYSPCLRGRKWVLGYCKHTKSPLFLL